MQLIVQLQSHFILDTCPHVSDDIVANYLLEASLNSQEEAFELERELVLIVDDRLHDPEIVSDSWHYDATVDVYSCVEIVDESVQYDAEVEFSTVTRVQKNE